MLLSSVTQEDERKEIEKWIKRRKKKTEKEGKIGKKQEAKDEK